MKNRNIIILVLLFILLGILIVLNSNSDEGEEINQDKLKVITTIYPLYDIARTMGKDVIEVISVLPPGASPHTFEATPELVKSVADTDIMFTAGAGVDDWALTIIEGGTKSNVQIIDISEYIDLMIFADNEQDEHEELHDHGGFDPHYWLDPDNGMIMARIIKDSLVERDPENTNTYENNFESFSGLLLEKDAMWQEKLGRLEDKNLAVFHDAWNYFAKHFGLNIVATFEPFPGKTPSPKYLVEMSKTIEENNIRSIFIEPQLSQDAAEVFASDLGVEVDLLDPLGGVGERGGYIEMLEYNVSQVYKALSN